MPAYPSSVDYSEEPYDDRPGGLHPIPIEDSSKPRSKHLWPEVSIQPRFLKDFFFPQFPGQKTGRHLVLVSKALGPCILQMKGWHVRLCMYESPWHKRLPSRVTQVLAYLHSEGICHADLASSDLLFQLADFDVLSHEKFYEQLGFPMVVDLHESCLDHLHPHAT